jgi:sugar phosphate isomerase/epimerase
MTTQPVFRVGISFHTFVQEFISFVYSFEDLMEMASVLGGGVEIVGPSNHRGFPEVTDEFERAFKSSVDRYGLIPTSYGSYADPFMLPDRNLTPDELYDYTVIQLKGAAKLGFPVVRLQYYTSGVAHRLIPVAEKLNIKMGYELHTPLMIESPKVLELRAQIDHLSSDRLGLIPDCGIFARSISQHHFNVAHKLGLPEAVIQKARELWKQKATFDQAAEIIRAMGVDEKGLMWIDMVWGSLGYSEPAALADIKSSIIHVHGKFFSIVNGDEPDLRYDEVVKTLLDIGYTGWMSTEYEGAPTDTFEVAKAHQEMVKGYIAKHLKV